MAPVMHACHRCHEKALLAGILMNIVQLAGKSQRIIRMVDGEALFIAGTPATQIYLIDRGALNIVEPYTDRLMRTYLANEIIGLPEVLKGDLWPATAIVRGITDIRVFPAHILKQRIDEMPSEAQTLLQSITHMCA